MMPNEGEREKPPSAANDLTVLAGGTCVSPSLPIVVDVPTSANNNSGRATETVEQTCMDIAKANVEAAATTDLGNSSDLGSIPASRSDAGHIKPTKRQLKPDGRMTELTLAGHPADALDSGGFAASDNSPEKQPVQNTVAELPRPANIPVPDNNATPPCNDPTAQISFSAVPASPLPQMEPQDDASSATTELNGCDDPAVPSESRKGSRTQIVTGPTTNLRMPEQTALQSAALPPLPIPLDDWHAAESGRLKPGDGARGEATLPEHKKPMAESSNGSIPHSDKTREDHDAAEPIANGRILEGVVRGLAETNHHLDSASATSAPSTGVAPAEEHSGTAGETDRQPDLSRTIAKPLDGGGETSSESGTPASLTVNTARLVERLKESEINLSLRSADFGDIAIHTAIGHERLSAQISLERDALSKVIAGEIPALQSKLSQEHGIHATIEVQQQGQSFSGQGGQPQSQPGRPQPQFQLGLQREEHETTATLSANNADGRLDIRV
jgi:hypothetical protein